MTIVTQDGRKLEVTKHDKVEFEAGTYVGRSVIYYVDAKIHTCREGFIRHINIRLAEYTDSLKTAEHEKEILETALDSGKKFIHMGAFHAPKDDLMPSLKAIDVFYKQTSPKGYYIEVGMINGKTNSSYGFNPDKDGSYATALAKYQNSKTKVA